MSKRAIVSPVSIPPSIPIWVFVFLLIINHYLLHDFRRLSAIEMVVESFIVFAVGVSVGIFTERVSSRARKPLIKAEFKDESPRSQIIRCLIKQSVIYAVGFALLLVLTWILLNIEPSLKQLCAFLFSYWVGVSGGRFIPYIRIIMAKAK